MIQRQPVRRVEVAAAEPGDPEDGQWPMTLPAVRQLQTDGLDLGAGVTLLVGENGTGKSTLVEGIALAYGLSPEGGSTGSQHSTRVTESGLHRRLQISRGLAASKWGFFLRAETMHSWFSYLEDNPRTSGPPDVDFHRRSHGESFLDVFASRFATPGFYVLDEPEAALSFTSTLILIDTLTELAGAGSQVLCATHSPLLAALPGARILECGEAGYREVAWRELGMVVHWQRFLDAPHRYLGDPG